MAPVRRHFLILLSLSLGACATKISEPRKKTAIYNVRPVHVQSGIASWYRDHRTASGERFNVNALAAAHINDRGPYIRGRIIDLTVGAARELGMYHRGIAQVRIEVLREIPILEKPNILINPPREQRKKTPFAFLSANR